MKTLTAEQVFGLRLNIHSYIWTTGFIELNLDESYKTPFGLLTCTPGTGWHLKGSFGPKEETVKGITSFRNIYPLDEFLYDNNIEFAFDCPIIRKLQKRKTNGIIFKLLGFPHNTKCWI